MLEGELPGVEHLAGEIPGAFSAVEFIAEDGMAEMMEVDPDLVGPAAVQNAFDQADLAVGAHDLVFGFRGTALAPRDTHPLPMDRMTRDGFVDNTAARPRQTCNQGKIDFANGPGRELF